MENLIPQEKAIPELIEVRGAPVLLYPGLEAHRPNHVDLRAFMDAPSGKTSLNATLKSEESFAAYVNRRGTPETTGVFFDPDAARFVAVFDDPLYNDGVGWGQKRATFTLETHRILEAWRPFIRGWASQSDWIEFLDTRADDFVSPSPAEMLSLVRNFRAAKTSEFHHVEYEENGDVDLGYATKTVPDASIKVPTDIEIAIPLWKNGEKVKLSGRFRYRVAGGGLSIRILLKSLDDILEVDALVVKDRVEKATKCDVLLGSPGTLSI